MPERILLIQGHPDASARHLSHALADACAEGAHAAGHEVRNVDVATLDFPLLRSAQDWEKGVLPAGLVAAREAIGWAERIVVFFPLWLGDVPALVYRWFFRAHSVKSLERNILGFVGIAPVDETLIGLVGALTPEAAIFGGVRHHAPLAVVRRCSLRSIEAARGRGSMSKATRHQINALILALVAVHAIYWFVSGQSAGTTTLMVGLRVAQGIVGVVGALWFFSRSRGAAA